MTTNRNSIVFLLSLATLTLALGLVIMWPFLKPILFALALAMVFHPFHTWVCKRVNRPNVAALISTILVLLALILPALVLGRAITSELAQLYRSLNGNGSEEMSVALRWMTRGEQGINEVAHQAGLTSFDIRSSVRQQLSQGSGWLLRQVAGFLSNLTGVLVGAVVTALSLFYFLRHGTSLRDRAASIMPLTADNSGRLFRGVHDVVVGSVYGIFAIGLLQGLLVGVAFWVLGLSSPVLWGLVTAFLSLVPIVGTAGVWVPAAIILAATGHWTKALILVGWGTAVVHPVDNILRPYLVGQRAKLSAIALFFAILGGVKAFGLIGLMLGPVVLSIVFVLWAILRDEVAEWEPSTSPEDAANRPEDHGRSAAGALAPAQAAVGASVTPPLHR
jgi:predicted PurR-regulated permease PerM